MGHAVVVKPWLVVAIAVLTVGVPACDSGEDDAEDAGGTTTTSTSATSSTSTDDPTPAWGETLSSVEGLPVPDIAKRGPEMACSEGECETWSMPSGVSVTAVRRWYLERVAPTSPWRDSWTPCFGGRFDSTGVQSDGQETLGLVWSRNGSESLSLTASGELGDLVQIAITRRSQEMPCQ